MSSDLVEFGELPLPTREGLHRKTAAALRARPNEWAKLPIASPTSAAARSKASRINRGMTSGYEPAHSFETVVRGLDIWGRYVGGDES